MSTRISKESIIEPERGDFIPAWVTNTIDINVKKCKIKQIFVNYIFYILVRFIGG